MFYLSDFGPILEPTGGKTEQLADTDMNEKLTEIEYDVLNALYFVEPFDHILADCPYPETIVKDVLRQLITRKYVVPMRFDSEKQEYIRSFMYDGDDMRAYAYLATKEGLIAHNSR